MMDLVAMRRSHVIWNISQNPTVISVGRTEKVRQGGGYNDVTTTVGPFTVRLFMYAVGIIGNEDVSVGGIQQRDRWSILADHTSDIRASTNVIDTFEIPNIGHFRVKAVYPQMINGQLVGIQANVEKVS